MRPTPSVDRSPAAGEAWHDCHAGFSQPRQGESPAGKGIPGHHPPPNPGLTAGAKDAKMIQPPENAPPEDSLGSHARAARRQHHFVRGRQLERDLPSDGAIPRDQHSSCRDLGRISIRGGRQLTDLW